MAMRAAAAARQQQQQQGDSSSSKAVDRSNAMPMSISGGISENQCSSEDDNLSLTERDALRRHLKLCKNASKQPVESGSCLDDQSFDSSDSSGEERSKAKGGSGGKGGKATAPRRHSSLLQTWICTGVRRKRIMELDQIQPKRR